MNLKSLQFLERRHFPCFRQEICWSMAPPASVGCFPLTGGRSGWAAPFEEVRRQFFRLPSLPVRAAGKLLSPEAKAKLKAKLHR